VTTLHDIEQLREKLHYEEVAYLLGKGWVSSSQTPTFVVLWSREWRGRHIMVNQHHAVDFQIAIDKATK